MSAYIDSYKFHETLWSLSISNGILLKIINQKDCYENSYLHILVSFSDEKIIQLVFDKIKEKLPGEFKNLLKIKGFRNRNLLQKAADKQENVKVHKFLWDLFYESCNSVESFINFLKKGDDQGDTTLHLIVKFSTAAVFEFAFEYFEKFNLTNLKIKEILLWREKNDRNFLQTAAILNKSLDLHKCLWKIIEKFVPEDEIISMIEHKDKINCNLLFAIVRFNNKEITEFTWEKIKEYLKTHQQQKEYLEEKGYKGNNLYKNVTYRNYEVSRWVKNILFEYGII
ncbi:hypothetical protein PVAND_014511 [Polypedilum vanderplanki]|nr:hypothetical protein PVAND_014511 [Polypedilum vanderplanki]